MNLIFSSEYYILVAATFPGGLKAAMACLRQDDQWTNQYLPPLSCPALCFLSSCMLQMIHREWQIQFECLSKIFLQPSCLNLQPSPTQPRPPISHVVAYSLAVLVTRCWRYIQIKGCYHHHCQSEKNISPHFPNQIIL